MGGGDERDRQNSAEEESWDVVYSYGDEEAVADGVLMPFERAAETRHIE